MPRPGVPRWAAESNVSIIPQLRAEAKHTYSGQHNDMPVFHLAHTG